MQIRWKICPRCSVLFMVDSYYVLNSLIRLFEISQEILILKWIFWLYFFLLYGLLYRRIDIEWFSTRITKKLVKLAYHLTLQCVVYQTIQEGCPWWNGALSCLGATFLDISSYGKDDIGIDDFYFICLCYFI